MNALHVKHTLTYRGEPLAVVDNLPGAYAELRPEQLRRLASALMSAADDCEKHARTAHSKHAPNTFADYPLRTV